MNPPPSTSTTITPANGSTTTSEDESSITRWLFPSKPLTISSSSDQLQEKESSTKSAHIADVVKEKREDQRSIQQQDEGGDNNSTTSSSVQTQQRRVQFLLPRQRGSSSSSLGSTTVVVAPRSCTTVYSGTIPLVNLDTLRSTTTTEVTSQHLLSTNTTTTQNQRLWLVGTMQQPPPPAEDSDHDDEEQHTHNNNENDAVMNATATTSSLWTACGCDTLCSLLLPSYHPTIQSSSSSSAMEALQQQHSLLTSTATSGTNNHRISIFRSRPTATTTNSLYEQWEEEILVEDWKVRIVQEEEDSWEVVAPTTLPSLTVLSEDAEEEECATTESSSSIASMIHIEEYAEVDDIQEPPMNVSFPSITTSPPQSEDACMQVEPSTSIGSIPALHVQDHTSVQRTSSLEDDVPTMLLQMLSETSQCEGNVKAIQPQQCTIDPLINGVADVEPVAATREKDCLKLTTTDLPQPLSMVVQLLDKERCLEEEETLSMELTGDEILLTTDDDDLGDELVVKWDDDDAEDEGDSDGDGDDEDGDSAQGEEQQQQEDLALKVLQINISDVHASLESLFLILVQLALLKLTASLR